MQSRILSVVLAGSLGLAGCHTTYLGGDYHPKGEDLVRKSDKRIIAEGGEWYFLWGLLDTGEFDLDKKIAKNTREREVVTDIEVKDRLSVGGFFLWILTGGLVSHHTLVVRGRTGDMPLDRTSSAPRPSERETIVVPAQPAPAGYPDRERERSADFQRGYEAGIRDGKLTPDERERAAERIGRDSPAEYRRGYEAGIRDGLSPSETPRRGER